MHYALPSTKPFAHECLCVLWMQYGALLDSFRNQQAFSRSNGLIRFHFAVTSCGPGTLHDRFITQRCHSNPMARMVRVNEAARRGWLILKAKALGQWGLWLFVCGWDVWEVAGCSF